MTALQPKIDFMFFSDSASYFIVDEISGGWLAEQEFASAGAAQAYLDAHRDELLRRGPPALDPAESEMVGKAIEVFERRLASGEIDACEAAGIIKQFARISSRCPGDAFRQRLTSRAGSSAPLVRPTRSFDHSEDLQRPPMTRRRKASR